MTQFTAANATSFPEDASDFARARHAGQTRKGKGDLPYFVHPAAVAATLMRLYPHDPELAAAGFCHDLLEDTKTERVELVTRYGERVAMLVSAVSSPRGRDWSHTRELALAQLRGSPDDAVRLKAADALDNAGTTLVDVYEQGLATLGRFGAKPDKLINWYRSIAVLAAERLGADPIVTELTSTVDALDQAIRAR